MANNPRVYGDDMLWNVRPNGMSPEEYCHQRDMVLLSGDWRKLKQFARRLGSKALPSDEAIEISLHQLITAVQTLPFQYRKQSYRWLFERGYRSWDDGELSGHFTSS